MEAVVEGYSGRAFNDRSSRSPIPAPVVCIQGERISLTLVRIVFVGYSVADR